METVSKLAAEIEERLLMRNEVMERLRRVHLKSLKGILNFQERIDRVLHVVFQRFENALAGTSGERRDD